MKIVSVHSHKGGAGKTALALLTAGALVRRGQRVCVIDLDFMGAGIDPAIRVAKPKHYLEEALMATPSSTQEPSIPDLVAAHRIEAAPEPIACILNAGRPMSGARENKYNDLHERILNMLELEDNTGFLENGLTRLLDRLAEDYDYVILDCHPSLTGISEVAFRIQMARPAARSATLLAATTDRAHTYGLLKEMHRRSRAKGKSLRPENMVLVVNMVEEDAGKRPYKTTLDTFAVLGEELKRDPVVGDEAPTLLARFPARHYCRILWHEEIASFTAIRSEGRVPPWPKGIIAHSGTALCEELFGPR